MLHDNIMDVLDKYYPETRTDEALKNRLGNDPGGVVMLLKAARAKEEALGLSDLPEGQKKTLFSAQNVLMLYDDYIKPAAKSFNDAVMSEDAEKLMPMMEDSLYQNSFIYAGNDFISESPDKNEVEQLYHTGSLASLQPIMEKAEKMHGDMVVLARFHYGKDIDPQVLERSAAEQQAIGAYIDEHPKEVAALALMFEKNREAGKAAKVFNAADLQAKCELPEVLNIAAGISFVACHDSLKEAARQIEPLDGLHKPLHVCQNGQKAVLSAKHAERSA